MKVAPLITVALILCIAFPGLIQAKKKPKPNKFCVGKDGNRYKEGEGYEDREGEACIHYICTKKNNKKLVMKNRKCVEDGEWSSWSSWSDCSTTCGSATKTRTRTCSSPEPSDGGKPCNGKEKEIEKCSNPPCGPDINEKVDLLELNFQSLNDSMQTLQTTMLSLMDLMTIMQSTTNKQGSCMSDLSSSTCPDSAPGKIGLVDGFNANKAGINANKAGVTSTKADIRTNKAEITSTKADVNTNKADINANKAGVTSNKADINTNTADIMSTKADINTNKVGINTNKAGINTNKADINTNEAGVNTNKAGINTNKADINTNEADINTNEADINTNEAGINTNKADINTNEADINTNEADINTNEAGINTNKAGVNINKAGINTNKADINTNKAGINTNKAGVNINKAGINTNKANINTNEADINTNEAGINTNEAGINSNKADINTNKAAINTNKDNIAGHHTGCIAEDGVAIGAGNNVPNGQGLPSSGQSDCSLKCYFNNDCIAWTLRVADNLCWLKTVYEGHTGKVDGWITGTKECGSNTGNGPECNSYTAITDSWRKIDYNNRGNEPTHCDRELAKKWYRFEGEAGSKLPTARAPTGSITPDSMICGTHATSWMTSGHPHPKDQIVTRKVCFEYLDDGCFGDEDVTIRVRACFNNDLSVYYVYELSPPTYGCSLAYCALP